MPVGRYSTVPRLAKRTRKVRGILQGRCPWKAESFEDAGEIVGTPAVTQYEGNSDRLWVLAFLQSARARAEQLLEAFIHIQLLQQNLNQCRRPPERLGGGDCRTDDPRSEITAPGLTLVPARLRPDLGFESERRLASDPAYVGTRTGARLADDRRGGMWRTLYGLAEAGAYTCFTANAILQRFDLCEIAGVLAWPCAPGAQDSGMRFPERNRPGSWCSQKGRQAVFPRRRCPKSGTRSRLTFPVAPTR